VNVYGMGMIVRRAESRELSRDPVIRDGNREFRSRKYVVFVHVSTIVTNRCYRIWNLIVMFFSRERERESTRVRKLIDVICDMMKDDDEG